jgi:hypothetical protein
VPRKAEVTMIQFVATAVINTNVLSHGELMESVAALSRLDVGNSLLIPCHLQQVRRKLL